MTENKKLDILMATYNGEKYLEEQIDSIINQTYKNWNLIIRDDGSKDETLKIIEEYEKKDNRIKNIKDDKGNLGIVKNFEELLKASNSQFIMFSDQDDIWDKNKIEKYLKKIMNFNCKKNEFLIHSDAVLYNVNRKIIKNSFISDKARKEGMEYTFFNYFVQGATILITKGLKEYILPFPDEVYLHDRYIHLIAEIFFKRVFINEALIYYRQHDNNQVGAKNSFKSLLKKRYFDERDYKLIKMIYNKYNEILDDSMKRLIEDYFEITDEKTVRIKRYLKLKNTEIDMTLKKKISLLLKG